MISDVDMVSPHFLLEFYSYQVFSFSHLYFFNLILKFSKDLTYIVNTKFIVVDAIFNFVLDKFLYSSCLEYQIYVLIYHIFRFKILKYSTISDGQYSA